MARKVTVEPAWSGLFETGAHCFYDGPLFLWGHAVVLGETAEGVVIDLDHFGEVVVPPGDVTVHAEPDLAD